MANQGQFIESQLSHAEFFCIILLPVTKKEHLVTRLVVDGVGKMHHGKELTDTLNL